MDSYRVLRNAAATLLAAVTITGGHATPAQADRDLDRTDAESNRQEPPTLDPAAYEETAYEPEVPRIQQVTPERIYKRRWSTSARPRPRIQVPAIKNKAIAFRIVVQRAWTVRQFRCLDSLWTRESNWNHRATNSSSGAYGIPQALPAAKMAGAGWDWRSNPVTQIRWGLTYIKGRYGSPCGAWGHFRAHNWY
ncbi:lytic transglycosylase domain-containing protein [Spongiactinospora gelatinilytica]|uniref:aggregation-promoting factor C-terminal-like domain-containing protein n=1 Tax=Spongiactinospora gelatinilytica TaxID=2666298 RepID=UPI0018F4DFC4|nr:lytic transglycosylase domain-containing protein [Spongiactinospora gelatinilytica]